MRPATAIYGSHVAPMVFVIITNQQVVVEGKIVFLHRNLTLDYVSATNNSQICIPVMKCSF